jgi:hypothetical protein
MFGPLKKNKSDAPKMGGGKAVDFGKVKTGGAAGTAGNNIVSDSVLKSGNISSMGLNKEDQAALMAKRNEIPMTTKVLKYTSLVVFAFMLGSFLFLKSDLDGGNSYFGLTGLSDNTGSAYSRISQENTQKKTELAQIEAETETIRDRMKNQTFGNFVDQTEMIEAGQRTWFTTTKEVTRYDDDLGEEITNEEIVFGYIDMMDYIIDYFEDRSFKIGFFKEKEEGLNTSAGNSRNRNRVSTGDALLMSNEIDVKTIAINSNAVNMSLTGSDIYGKIFTLGGELVEIINSTPIFKNGSMRSFTRQILQSGDTGMNLSLRLDLQEPEEEDPADENFRFVLDWMEAENVIPTGN